MGAWKGITRWRPGLVGRFALSALAAFAGLAVVLSVVVSRQIIGRQEHDAQFHAEFVADSVLRYHLHAAELAAPITGLRYEQLDRFVRREVKVFPIVRVKIWSPSGTVLYSDDRRLVGRHFAGEPDREAATGQGPVSGVSDLGEPENVFERHLASKLYASYVPMWLPGHPRAGRPDAVVEVYQDYSSIQRQADSLFRVRLVTLGLGLAFLYLMLLPIAFRASRRLRRQNEQLHEQARSLEVLLAREQDSVAELRRLNQMKSDFVAVASHELRSPLTAIIGYVKTMRRPEFQGDPSAQSEFLAAMERQGDRLLRLVTNLLTASEVEDGAEVPTSSLFHLRELAEEVREGCDEAGTRIRLAIPDDLPMASLDRGELGQILANLVDNALKYSPDGAPVELGAAVLDGELRLWVRDQGIGIAPGDRERVFERFFQVDQSSTRRYGGVGLGLYLVRELTTAMGGRVQLESEPGMGSTFTVAFPAPAGYPVPVTSSTGPAATFGARTPGSA